ncbi:MAG: class I SAM-dependent methyltransferase [Gammaproteobacteria bacterium]
MPKRHQIQFPAADVRELSQDDVYFFLNEGSKREKIRLHDYDRIYKSPGLYEQVVYDRLKCQSPSVVVDVLKYVVNQTGQSMSEMRVLDLGAGNGIVGEVLKQHDVARVIGIDIIEEAREATDRDRPGVYDAYYVMDLCNMSDEQKDDVAAWSPDCLVSVAALGFGDIPAAAFLEAFNMVSDGGCVAFNLKETFFDRSDTSGLSHLVREMIFSNYLDMYHLQRYRHRLSMEGIPLYYFAIGGRKRADVPSSFLKSLNLS